MSSTASSMTIIGLRAVTNNPKQKSAVSANSAELANAILAFRDIANTRENFVRYKILVGFESVYPGHWEDQEYDFTAADNYRREQAQEYIAGINPANEDEWFKFITRCAETKSNDLATFPVFGQFIVNLAKAKPEVAERMLLKAGKDLRRFTPGFLNGLAISDRKDLYDRTLERELNDATNLLGLATHLRYSEVQSPTLVRRVLDKALEANDDLAVIECALLCMEQFGSGKVVGEEQFFADAFAYLNQHRDNRWVGGAWFLHKETSKFFDSLTAERSKFLLDNLFWVSRINHQVERLLTRIAERRLEDVWDYFGRRMERENMEGSEPFDAVPFSFHGLEKALGLDPALAIAKGLSWYKSSKRLFRFRGGRILSNSYPHCTSEFAAALTAAVDKGDPEIADFTLAILQNYEGEESTHEVLKAIVVRYPDDDHKLSSVRIVIDNTGVVSGEYGMADAYRIRKDMMKKWLLDAHPEVRQFAEDHIRELDNAIASETRRAENDSAMRRLEFGRSASDDNE